MCLDRECMEFAIAAWYKVKFYDFVIINFMTLHKLKKVLHQTGKTLHQTLRTLHETQKPLH